MATKGLKPRGVPYRRKREHKTNYAKRLSLLLSRKPRIVVRITNTRFIAQIALFEPQGDKIITATDSFALKKFGWQGSCKNIPAAYATGILLGKKALQHHIKEAILDSGFKGGAPRGRVYALVKGALDSGLQIPHGEGIFPDDERLMGKHLKSAALQGKFSQLLQDINKKTSTK